MTQLAKRIGLLVSFFSVGLVTGSTPGLAGAPGGTLYLEVGADPSTLNPITSSDAYASQIQSYVFSSLMDRSEETYEWMPALAEKYTISKDGKTFTFTLRQGAKWHDGKPVTAGPSADGATGRWVIVARSIRVKWCSFHDQSVWPVTSDSNGSMRFRPR